MKFTLSNWPSIQDFFPPTPQAYALSLQLFRTLPLVSLLQWTPLGKLQAMGKTSTDSRFNLPGRLSWVLAELVGPVNLLYILLTLPSKLTPTPDSPTSFVGTGLPAQNEILACLYLLHYVNRAAVSPLFLAPSMSPIHPLIVCIMALFQYINSTNIACWLVYSVLTSQPRPETQSVVFVSFASIIGLLAFILGLAGNIRSETTLYSLRRGAAKRKAKSEGKAFITYDKVYVIPPPEGMFKYILYPHYVFEWLEWTGFWILSGAWGLGWGFDSPALWFVLDEVTTMLPRAFSGRRWYEQRFGKRAVAGRAGAIPVLGL